MKLIKQETQRKTAAVFMCQLEQLPDNQIYTATMSWV